MKVQYYITEGGVKPVTEWLGSLRDKETKARIDLRIASILRGNFGKTRSVGEGVYELKIDFGPGYRVYYAKSGTEIVLLLCAGSKGTQDKDIRKAIDYWHNFKERKSKVK